MHHRLATWLPVLLCVTFTGCAAGTRLEGAPARADNLVTAIEKVHIEADRARDAIADAFERLQVLTGGNYNTGDVTQSYARFVQTIDTAEQQAKRFDEVVGPMQSSAAPVFEQWAADVASIGSERWRQRSQMRMAITKERYDAILSSALESQVQLNAFVGELRDHALFLAHDLNPSALDEIQEDVKLVAASAQKLDRELDLCLSSARAYVDNSALPSTQGMPASPGRNR